jgi:hypothetical protein
MVSHSLKLQVLPVRLAVCRLGPDEQLPSWAAAGPFASITRTADELSIVCLQEAAPEGVRCERDWRGLRIVGTIPFAMVGVLHSLTAPLAEAGVTVFVLSTFDTDYLLVKEKDLEATLTAFQQAGHSIE